MEGGPTFRMGGLTSSEAAARLAADGPNVLPEGQRRTILVIIREVVLEPMFLLLLAASTLYFIMGDLEEALTLLGSVVVIFSIAAVQQGRTERALEALRDLSSPRARVLRDGEMRTLPARELVRGDIVSLAEGDRVPADAIFRDGPIVSVDESLLTGEAVPVSKQPSMEAEGLGAPGGDSGASLFSGTLIVSGRCLAEVFRTGARSEMGKLGVSLKTIQPGGTPLQREVTGVVRRMAAFAIVASIGLVALSGINTGDWVQATLAGLTLAIALLPEEFPVVLTVFLALGAWRMVKLGVLTRRVTALETLGAVDVLCTDKTGTLTVNRMTIRRLRTETMDFTVPGGGTKELPEDVHSLVEYGVLACPRDPFDPMEKAFHALGNVLTGTEHLHPRWNGVREYPLSSELLAVTHVWRDEEQSRRLTVAAKGATEAVFDLCHLGAGDLERWRERVHMLASRGMRVLGVARSTVVLGEVPEHVHDIPFELVGIVGLEDPLRPEVPAAVALCRAAGIRTLMITGDHVETARAMALEAGLDASRPLTGAEVESLGETELAARLLETEVVARAVPEHKLRIVRALRGKGLLVGMTGDGVNDAPALKSADVGIAMGGRGTDVAREAASLVLEKDDFGSIVAAVRTGRRIYDNLQKAFGYIVAVHIPIAGLSLVPSAMGWTAIVAPVHVVFLELVIDPACSVVLELESEEPDSMSRPPRPKGTRLLDTKRLLRAFGSGALALSGVLWAVASSKLAGQPIAMQRTLAFIGLLSGNLALLLTHRSDRQPFWVTLRARNRSVPVLFGAVVGSIALLLGVPFIREIFGFNPVGVQGVVTTVVASTLPVFLLDFTKSPRRGIS